MLRGSVEVRHPGGSDVLGSMDLVCFSRGPEGAHGITNVADEPARVLMFSNVAELSATAYPDSDKIGMYSAGERHLFRRADAIGYYEGE